MITFIIMVKLLKYRKYLCLANLGAFHDIERTENFDSPAWN